MYKMNKKYILIGIVSLVGLLVMIGLLVPSPTSIVPKIDDLNEISFNGDGYYTTDTNGLLNGSNLSLSLDFKTIDTRWLLEVYGINVVVKSDGILRVSFPTGSREIADYFLGKVNDDVWHNFSLKIENNTWTARIDTRTITGQLPSKLIPSSTLYLGGFEGIDVYSTFKGRIRNVKYFSTPKSPSTFKYIKLR